MKHVLYRRQYQQGNVWHYQSFRVLYHGESFKEEQTSDVLHTIEGEDPFSFAQVEGSYKVDAFVEQTICVKDGLTGNVLCSLRTEKSPISKEELQKTVTDIWSNMMNPNFLASATFNKLTNQHKIPYLFGFHLVVLRVVETTNEGVDVFLRRLTVSPELGKGLVGVPMNFYLAIVSLKPFELDGYADIGISNENQKTFKGTIPIHVSSKLQKARGEITAMWRPMVIDCDSVDKKTFPLGDLSVDLSMLEKRPSGDRKILFTNRKQMVGTDAFDLSLIVGKECKFDAVSPRFYKRVIFYGDQRIGIRYTKENHLLSIYVEWSQTSVLVFYYWVASSADTTPILHHSRQMDSWVESVDAVTIEQSLIPSGCEKLIQSLLFFRFHDDRRSMVEGQPHRLNAGDLLEIFPSLSAEVVLPQVEAMVLDVLKDLGDVHSVYARKQVIETASKLIKTMSRKPLMKLIHQQIRSNLRYDTTVNFFNKKEIPKECILRLLNNIPSGFTVGVHQTHAVTPFEEAYNWWMDDSPVVLGNQYANQYAPELGRFVCMEGNYMDITITHKSDSIAVLMYSWKPDTYPKNTIEDMNLFLFESSEDATLFMMNLKTVVDFQIRSKKDFYTLQTLMAGGGSTYYHVLQMLLKKSGFQYHGFSPKALTNHSYDSLIEQYPFLTYDIPGLTYTMKRIKEEKEHD